MKIINPLQIKQKDLPLIVLSDNVRGLFAFAIKAHSKGSYNHTMSMIRPGFVATQGMTYKEVPIEKYMNSKYRLKFWQPQLTGEQEERYVELVNEGLDQNWFKKSYDILGVLGQLIKIKLIQNPWKNYCSERETLPL